MKQFFIILSVMVIASGGVIVFHYLAFPQLHTPSLPLVSFAPSLSPSSSPKPSVGTPVSFQIPSLNINATVESVGLDSQNRMDVPKIVDDVGWYNLGYKPGENGNAVIDGHYDRVDGSPAVFYRISSLKQGDDLVVKDSLKRTYDFKVSNTVTYPYNQLPLQDIFAGHTSSQLILITCSGIWDQGTHNYSTRTVVYSMNSKKSY